MSKNLKTQSKFLSLVLRHSPETIGIQLDKNGWVPINELLEAAVEHGQKINLEKLIEIVETNDKQQFTFSGDGLNIRANQGHSIETIDMQLESSLPPDILFHGTVSKFLPEILNTGLKKMSRQHVHLSSDKETAITVAQRRGKSIILSINTKQMVETGYAFYLSKNGVWLTDVVPPLYIVQSIE